MKANELRIGNYAMGNKPFVIDANHIGMAHNYEVAQNGHERFESIQLTPEWLERFGFEKFRLIKDGIVFDNSWLRINESMVAYWRGGFIGKIQHVNSLQNLYFALTGSELTLKN